MRIYISADIEGVAGVVSPQQGEPGNLEYERARRLMTEEVNAAIAGAFEGGAADVLVNDSHGPNVNLLPELLDPRAELILGKPKPMNMLAGLTAEYAGVMCVGYHTGAGRPGVLSHTISGNAFRAIRLNGRDCAEATLYGAYAGSLGVAVILLSGDNVVADELGPLFPGAEQVVVKRALSQRAAQCASPEEARRRLRRGAEAAVRRAREIKPFILPAPFRLEAELNTPAMADLAAAIPVAERAGPATVAFDAESMAVVVGWVNTLSALSNALR